MRTTLLLTLILIFATALQGSPLDNQATGIARTDLISADPSAVLIRYDMSEISPQPVEVEGVQYTCFPAQNEAIVLQNGMPLLPAVSRWVVVSPNSGIELIVTEEDTPRRIRAVHPPLIVEDPTLGDASVRPNSDGIFPPNLAEMGEPVVMRGVRMVQVTIYPVQYDFNSGSFIHHESVQAEVRASDGEAVNPVVNPIRRGRSPDFLKIMNAMAINGAEVGRDDPERDALPKFNGHYLVVSHVNLVRFVAPFIEWRRKAGYKMDIYAVPANDASQDNTIKQRIQQRYQAYVNDGQEPFEHVLTVGDRSQYYEMQGAETVLESPQGAATFGVRHGDWLYGCIEGNDETPDVSTGRFAGGGANILGLIVGRTLAYEATPDMDDPSWFTRGGALSQHWGNSAEYAYHITNPSMVRWAEAVLRNLGYDDVRVHENMNWDQYGAQTGPVFENLLNDGANAVLARSENYHWCTRNPNRHYFDQDIDDNTSFPFRLNASGHGEWSAEMEFRTGAANHLKGWVAVTFSWNGPVTGISTSLWADEIRTVMLLGLPLGWGYSYACANLPVQLPTFNASQIQVGRTDHNYFGDPGLRAWRGVPRVVEMEAPESIAPQARLVEVFVHEPDSDTPVPGAKVTFYAAGNRPAFDHASYADYNRFWIKNTVTDDDGLAQIILGATDTLFSRTTLYITVTGDDIAPYFHETAIEAQETSVELAEVVFTELNGNGDNRLNPGETFEVSLTAANIGENAANGTSATVISMSQFVEIDGNNSIDFGDIAADESIEGNVPVTLVISPSCPDAAARPLVKPSLLVEFSSGEQTWRSAISLDTWAPHLEFREVLGRNGDVIPDSGYALSVEIANVGRIAADEMSVELHSRGQGVTVIDGASTFPSIAAGRTASQNGGPFDISGNKVVVPGSRSDLYMVFSTGSGFIDTSWFSVQIMQPRAGAPIGPDIYGYICFDDTDTAWNDVAPVYDWEEINPDDNQAEFEGTRLNFRGQSDRDLGEAIVVPLGFTTRFYGVDYDTITVVSHGYIAMGNRPRFINHHNFPLNESIGGVGMIAPFWDDLRFGQNSRVFVFHDEEDSRYIIQWHRMRPATGDADQTFQVIIYDSRVWITESGDQNILMQYKTIQNLSNIRNGDAEGTTNNPYASVGICSPFGNSGINYTAKNQYPPGAASLGARRAILFTTSVRFRAGTLYGWVTDYATGWGIEGATVYTKHGFVATTDADGYWRIAEALADILFDVTAHKQGFNDSTYLAIDDSLMVPEGDSLQIDFSLLHPEFSPTTYILEATLDPELIFDVGFSVTNTGNGPLEWTAEKRLLGDANAAPWDLRRSYNVSQITDDDRIEGVVFAEDKFFLPGANGLDSNMIYILDRDGALLESFQQVGSSRYGYKDMDWDDEFGYLWAAGEDSIYALTTWGEVGISWPDPHNPSMYIAFDKDEGVLYICGTTTNYIIRCDRDGNQLGSISSRRLRIYGLAWWPEDPDGDKLYILNRPGDWGTFVTKMNTETGDTTTIFQFADHEGSTGQQGAWITNEFDVYSWVLMTTQNISGPNGGDRLEIHQLDARKDWMDLSVWSGHLDTWETQDFTMRFNSAGLPDTLFEGEMFFKHNADSGVAHISISLQVIGPMPPEPFPLLRPVDGDTLTALPLHGDTLNVPEVRFSWLPSYDPNHADTLISYIHWLSCRDQTISFTVADTFNVLNLDTLGLPLWFDSPLTWWVQALSPTAVPDAHIDTVDCVRQFTLNIIPNSLENEELIPVEFGLQNPYPNPFNNRTAIRFGADRAERTTLIAYDLAGREVARLFDATPTVGYHSVIWNADLLPTGIYVLRLESAGRNRVAKVALIK